MLSDQLLVMVILLLNNITFRWFFFASIINKKKEMGRWCCERIELDWNEDSLLSFVWHVINIKENHVSVFMGIFYFFFLLLLGMKLLVGLLEFNKLDGNVKNFQTVWRILNLKIQRFLDLHAHFCNLKLSTFEVSSQNIQVQSHFCKISESGFIWKCHPYITITAIIIICCLCPKGTFHKNITHKHRPIVSTEK